LALFTILYSLFCGMAALAKVLWRVLLRASAKPHVARNLTPAASLSSPSPASISATFPWPSRTCPRVG